MATSQINIQGLITGTAIGTEKIGVLTVTGGTSAAVGVLASTTTPLVFPVPPNVTNSLIIPVGNGSSAAITMKTSRNAGDTGLPLSETNPTLYPFSVTAPTTLTFVLGATWNGYITVKFW